MVSFIKEWGEVDFTLEDGTVIAMGDQIKLYKIGNLTASGTLVDFNSEHETVSIVGNNNIKCMYVLTNDMAIKLIGQPVQFTNGRMPSYVFNDLIKELDGNSVNTLIEKNAKYSINGDSLHNFRSGAEIMGGTPAQACWGYLTKHLVALRDKVERNDFSDREDFLEKCQDTINYIRFLWCIGNEERTKLLEEKEN